MEQNEYLLEMQNIDKSFSGVQALKYVRWLPPNIRREIILP